jgi:hypothetical protein
MHARPAYGAYGAGAFTASHAAAAYAPPAAASSRFTAAPFAYNGRVCAVLLPCLATLAAHGGPPVAAVLAAGFMAAYVLDAARAKEGAFAAAWGTLGAANLALVYASLALANDASVALALLALLVGALALFLTGLWATLQFRWVQLEHPAAALAFERLLLAGCVPVGAAVQAWGVANAAGAEAAPWFLAVALPALYLAFSLPLPSSFRGAAAGGGGAGGGGRDAATVQGRGDAAIAFALAVALPPVAYAATHAAVLAEHWHHAWSLVLLASGPALALAAAPRGLWWLGASRSVAAARRLLLLAALAAFLAAVEARVVFHSFGQYIRLPAPWSFLAVGGALYGAAALALLHLGGVLPLSAAEALVGPTLMASASVGALAAGMPAWALPAPLAAAAGLGLFHDSRALRDYAIFVLGALATAAWFVWHHFWFLDVRVGGLHVRALCALALAAALPAAALPGAVVAGAHGGPIAFHVVAQAALVVFVEEALYAGDHAALTYGVHPMLPAYVVVATSAAGLALARALRARGALTEGGHYLAACIYASKLAMLVLPEARLTAPVLGLALAASPPLLLGGGLSAVSVGVGAPPPRAAPWQRPALAAAVLAATAAARFAVFDVLRFALGRRPPEALAVGALALVAAAGCAPLVARYCRGSAAAKRALLLLAAAGALLALLRPPLPLAGGAACPAFLPFRLCPRLWDEGHVPEHEQDDAAIWGDGLRRREHWPLWLLAAAALLGLAAATAPPRGRRAGAPLRAPQAAAAAALVGGYMALEFFPGMPLLQAATLASALLAALVVALLPVPARGAAALLPLLGAAWAACLPAVWLAAHTTALPPLPPDAWRLFPDPAEALELEEERREAVAAAVLAAFAAEALLLALALKLKVAGAGAGARLPEASALAGDASLIDAAAEFLVGCLPAAALPGRGGGGGPGRRPAAREGGGWAPLYCNAAALLCFGLLLELNRRVTGGAPEAVLLLAPALLLLCRDALLFRGLTERRRYLPPVAAAAGVLAAAALSDVGDTLRVVATVGSIDADDVAYLSRNVGGLLLAAPALTAVLAHLWAPAPRGVRFGAALSAAAAAGLLAAELPAARLLGGLGAAGAAWLAAATQSSRQAGRKII